MVDRNSEFTRRAPTAGMDIEEILRNALSEEIQRAGEGQLARAAHSNSRAQTSTMAGGGMGAAGAGQQARGAFSQRQYEVGSADDALGAFTQQIDQADKLLELMRKAFEAQQPGWDDYAKQAAMTLGPKLLAL
jgi:hypothetical protein